MRHSFLALIALFTLITSAPAARAAEKSQSPQAHSSNHVWTNEDLYGLRARGLITTFNQPSFTSTQPAAPSQTAPTGASAPVPLPPKYQDPDWYAQQAASLQSKLDEYLTALNHAQEGLAKASDGVTQPGISLDKGNAGITPQAGIAILEARVDEVQNQIDELGDLARRNGIPPGALRE